MADQQDTDTSGDDLANIKGVTMPDEQNATANSDAFGFFDILDSEAPFNANTDSGLREAADKDSTSKRQAMAEEAARKAEAAMARVRAQQNGGQMPPAIKPDANQMEARNLSHQATTYQNSVHESQDTVALGKNPFAVQDTSKAKPKPETPANGIPLANAQQQAAVNRQRPPRRDPNMYASSTSKPTEEQIAEMRAAQRLNSGTSGKQSIEEIERAARSMMQDTDPRVQEQKRQEEERRRQEEEHRRQAAEMAKRQQEEAARRAKMEEMRRQAQRNAQPANDQAQAATTTNNSHNGVNSMQNGYQAMGQNQYNDAAQTRQMPRGVQMPQYPQFPQQTQQYPPQYQQGAVQQPQNAAAGRSLPGMPGVYVSDDHFVVPQNIDNAKSDATEKRRARAEAVVKQMHDQYPDADEEFVEALRQLTILNASDLHLVVDARPTLRVDGRLDQIPTLSVWDSKKTWAAVCVMTTEEERARFERELELDISFSIGDLERFRVNVYRDRTGVNVALRTIPLEIKSAKELGLDPKISDLALLPRGLVLVCGPTGSGKSTTLAAIVDRANAERHDHILTIEDPIEFVHHHKNCIVNQREIGTDTKSFAEALKHALREDPDIILVGELRDLETISTALTAVETGHLVFATLHTQDAASTVDRLIDVYPENQQQQIRIQVAATLQAVIVQTLLPRASGKGRAPATEIMYSTPAIAALIRGAKTHQIRTQLQAGGELGMHTLDQDLARLVTKGIVSQQDAIKKCQVREEFEALCARGVA